MMTQSLALAKRPHVVVATPGRCADHLNSTDTFSLRRIKYLVLDEADRLLDPTFAPDLEVIFSNVAKKRQTLLFSATLSDRTSKYIYFLLNFLVRTGPVQIWNIEEHT